MEGYVNPQLPLKMYTKYKKCDVDLTRFLISFLEKRLTKKGEPFKFSPPAPLHPWYEDFGKLRRSMKVDARYLGAMIRWCFESSDFWKNVVRSPDNLRKNFEKIQLQMEAPKALTTFQKKRASIDEFYDEVSENVSRGTLSEEQFSFGMKVLLSCGGPNVDTQTLQVWYEMLSDLDFRLYGKAIKRICVEEESIQTLNLVQKIREVYSTIRIEEKRLKPANNQPWIEDYKKNPQNYGCPDETRAKIRLLTKGIG